MKTPRHHAWPHSVVTKLMLLITLVCAPALAEDDAYQLLRGDPQGYAKVIVGKPLVFPADHLPHPDYRIEWWYLTANLTDDSGAHYGVHWTLFRQSMTPEHASSGWASNQVWMAHAALSTPDGHVYQQRFARGGIGQAGVDVNAQGQFDAWLDGSRLTGTSTSNSPLPGQLNVTVDDYQVTLDMTADTPWVLQGKQGYSQKSNLGQASYYYSQPHIKIRGQLRRLDNSDRDNTDENADENTVKNTVKSAGTASQPIILNGQGWLDREWSSQPLAPDQPGWDWLSVHLDDGHALMVYRLRQRDGNDWVSGSWIAPDGSATTLAKDEIIFEPIATTLITTAGNIQRQLPLSWRVLLPAKNLSWTVTPLSKAHWLDTAFPYWEGPVMLTGSSKGQGFLELTGY
jgi:predicted secreted hydrolase